jgi:dGTP triphosphohydrolase
MSAYDNYVVYVTQHEQPLRSYATKTLSTQFTDGETVQAFYKRTLEKGDEFSRNKYRWRTPFQLDRDSVIYSSLFSRLSEKTQLYTGQGRVENRLTHTLKVAQLTRAIDYY